MIRQIPESRIKMLESIHYMHPGELDDYARERILREAGLEIAKKLFEFHKVEKITIKGQEARRVRIEVIVPPTPRNIDERG